MKNSTCLRYLLPLALCAAVCLSACGKKADEPVPETEPPAVTQAVTAQDEKDPETKPAGEDGKDENGAVTEPDSGETDEDTESTENGEDGETEEDVEEELEEECDVPGQGGVQPQIISGSTDGWTICWYLCGSNLETYYGCASNDIAEALSVALPDNVRIVVQTGGAYMWRNEMVSSGVIQRHLIDSSGMTLLEELPEADMGASGTLSSFLTFCRDYYSSAHNAIVFWNHGGGSVSGAEFDEVYGFDSLTLGEFTSAFGSVYGSSPASPPFEIVGFDACLMATVDVANAFRSFGHYLVASEEVEPGIGWNYAGMMRNLASNPYMNGDALGRAICDTYIQTCTECGSGAEATLSVTDLTRVGNLLYAYNELGNEALLAALDSPEFYAAFGREAARSENYGGNTPEQGYTNMVDLGHLARNSCELLPQNTQTVLDALADCVVYRVSGPYRAEATGLSCFYSYSGDLSNFVGFTSVGASEAFKFLYAYGLAGELSSAGADYVSSLSPNIQGEGEQPARQLPSLDNFDLSQAVNAYVDEYGYPVLELDPAFAAILREVRVRVRQAYLVNTELLRVDMVAWGESDLVGRDWENGIFRAYFDGYWAALDGVALYMEVVYSSDEYTLYSSPILLNGQLCNLQIAYEKEIIELENGGSQTNYDWHILGARESVDDETGMADKNLILLQPGDEIIPVYLVMQNIGEENAEWAHFYQPENAVTYYDEMDLDLFADFGMAVYDIEFEMVDSRNQKTYSDRFAVQVYDSDISVQLWDDYMAEADNAVFRWR